MKNLLLIIFLFASSFTFGQDIFQKNLYSFDRIMENREKLDLTEAQATKIKKIHAENAGEFSTLKWDLDAATSRLKSMLEESKIDPSLINKQMDEVLRLENLLKKKQLNTLVAIKNELSTNQQKLLEYRSATAIFGSGTNHGTLRASPKASSVRIGTPAQGFVSSTSSSDRVISWEGDRVVVGRNALSPSVKMEVQNGDPALAPLYILKTPDGQKELSSFEDIKPEDIESISVLKDKSATSKYGEKGKNGVIIITLKKNLKEEAPNK